MKTFSAREIDDGDDEWYEIKAFDAEDAAVDCAEQIYDNSAGEVNADAGLEIEVRDEAGALTRWHVEIEYAPSFHASPQKEARS